MARLTFTTEVEIEFNPNEVPYSRQDLNDRIQNAIIEELHKDDEHHIGNFAVRLFDPATGEVHINSAETD